MWEKVFHLNSQFQMIELLADKETGHIRLDLNLCTQFHSADEYRYHELAIFAPLVLCEKDPKKVLVLGGGDGLAAREALKFAEKIVVVDIDPEMTRLAKENELIRTLNKDSFNSEKVKIYNKDAYKWVQECRKNKYDIVFADYPDPSSLALEKLFEVEHYKEIERVLKPGGVFILQAGGGMIVPVMSTVGAKLRKVFKYCFPIKVEMLGGIQGFWIAMNHKPQPVWDRLKGVETRAFDKQMFLSATSWSKDLRTWLKEGDPEDSVYDMYVYGLALANHLSWRTRQ